MTRESKAYNRCQDAGPKTVAVLRAELGDVQRFARTDEVIAYGGMDIEIKESGLWKGKAKLSKRGSGLLRRMLYMAALRSISDDRFGFWDLLSALGGARSQKGISSDGRHA